MDVDSSMTSPAEPGDFSSDVRVLESNRPAASERTSSATVDDSSPASPAPMATHSPVSGPRHAPNYSVVNAILEKKEDGPGPRCGHTLTVVAAVGEEGTTSDMGPRLILFVGATTLEGNSANAEMPTSAGSTGIRMFYVSLLLLNLRY